MTGGETNAGRARVSAADPRVQALPVVEQLGLPGSPHAHIFRSVWVAIVLLSCAAFFCAGNWVIGCALRFDAPPVAIAFWRWLFALLVLLPFTAGGLRAHWRTISARWKKLALLALLATLLQHVPVYLALRSTGATNGALLNAISPVFCRCSSSATGCESPLLPAS